MSAKEDVGGRTLDEVQASWYENTRTIRDREDLQLRQQYDAQQDQLRARLVELYDRRSHIENELNSLRASIGLQEEEQARLVNSFKVHCEQIATRRQNEDIEHQQWFEQQRAFENANKANGHRASSKEMGNQQSGGSTGGWTSINGTANSHKGSSRRDDEEEPPADPGNMLGSGYHPMDDAEPNGNIMPFRDSSHNRTRPGTSNGTEMEIDDLDADALPVRIKKDGERPLKPKQRHSLPSFPAVVRSPAGKRKSCMKNQFSCTTGITANASPAAKQETPASESKGRSPSGRKSLPAARSHTQSVEASGPPDETEINHETLILKHNGQFYTEPPIMYGVPLERIDPKHPYWDPEWQPLEEYIQPQLDKWKEKHEALRRDPNAVRHTVFLANRQVNRGQAVLDYLKEGEFHPYQYVGKEMMQKFYKTFINYDTMFRLVNVHEELKKFDLDVTPLEWLRHRMHEVSVAQGDKFSLSKYTHDLYHDARLKALREKHGFGNIGRPSGYKVGEKNPDKAKKPKRESSGTASRRKARRSIGQVDVDEPSVMMDGAQPQLPPQPADVERLEPVTPRQTKKQRLEVAPLPEIKPEPEVDYLEYDGYTSTDSFSAGRIMHLDWRVYQIKTRTLTTSTEVTQYWTWKPDKSMFEHQVLRDVFPKVTWGYYQKPINFDLRLDEVIEIQYAPESQKVLVLIKDGKRGNILAHFKRERTKKRFLSFAKKKNVHLVKQSYQEMEGAWDSMESQTLPDEDSET
ncbi:uncharacterized protein BCR38DRAFT_410390 [Pseudomassariella vexata]|uniref:Uncharacterized protein n=1 Tax=Pseudomassariella vexata TaxID=1141098 RepID=A0A1Y2DWJ4_9PEZI|nr:uncharacterized protein BCR38DRAFT_410390 [Pseudomassariella vexata]ORY63474.1 hypothetical protein BCR38DRAFT_410390 [Pseudomassariella vexata]